MLNRVQAIRAWAALAVMFFHMGGAVGAEKYFGLTGAALAFGFGTHGVLLFFVLSGFIIHHVHAADLGRPSRFGRYIFRRIMRVYPSYWAPLLLVSGFAAVSGIGDVPSDPWVQLKTFLLAPQDPDVVGGTGAPVLIVAWSLQYELLFYLAFGLCIANLRLGLAVSGAFVCALLWLRYGGHAGLFPGFLSPVEFLLFGMGLVVSRHVARRLDPSAARVCLRLGLGLVAAAWIGKAGLALATAGEIHLFNTPAERILLGLVAMLLIGGAAALDLKAPMKINGATRWVANCSYLIYLVHFPVISAACKVSLAAGLDGAVGAAFAAALATGGTFALAGLLHEAVEKPVLRLARRVSGAGSRLGGDSTRRSRAAAE